MLTITVLLVAAQHATMAVAGLALAGYTLAASVTAPLRGRLADRRGLFGVAAVCGIGYALAWLGLLGGSLARGPAGLLVGAAAAAGACTPPVSPGLRSLWSVLAAAGLRQAAFALDAAVFDLAYITGPVLASALATGIAPAAAARPPGGPVPGPPAGPPVRRGGGCRDAGRRPGGPGLNHPDQEGGRGGRRGAGRSGGQSAHPGPGPGRRRRGRCRRQRRFHQGSCLIGPGGGVMAGSGSRNPRRWPRGGARTWRGACGTW